VFLNDRQGVLSPAWAQARRRGVTECTGRWSTTAVAKHGFIALAEEMPPSVSQSLSMARLNFHCSSGLGLLCAALAWSAAPAQSVVPKDSGDTAHADFQLMSRRDAIRFGSAVVATGLLVPFDRDIKRSLQSPRLQRRSGLQRSADALAFAGGPGPFIGGG